jgi:hypothetical protein
MGKRKMAVDASDYLIVANHQGRSPIAERAFERWAIVGCYDGNALRRCCLGGIKGELEGVGSSA